MKIALVGLLVVCLAPAGAQTQTVPSPLPAGSPVEQMPAAPGPASQFGATPFGIQMQWDMTRFQAEMQALRTGMRHDLLAVFTPAQRQFVASVLGQLAIADQPDPRAAARAIDASLSAAQQQAILQTVRTNTLRTQALVQAMFAAQTARTQGAPSELHSGVSTGVRGGSVQIARAFAMPMGGMPTAALGPQSAGTIVVATLSNSAMTLGAFPPLLQSTISPDPLPK